MGAQNSVVSNGLDAVAYKQDSRGDAVVPYSSVMALEAEGRARIADLEAQLAEAKSLLQQKEQELEQTQRMLARLEGMVEKQAKDSELEQERVSRMEAVLSEQSSGTEEKVAKLLLAVAGERHRAEVAEKAKDELAEQIAMEWQSTVQQLRDRLNEEESFRMAAEETAKGKEDSEQDSKQQLDAFRAMLREAQKKSSDLEAQLAELQSRDLVPQAPASESSLMVAELQQQFGEEVAKRMEVQNRLLEKDRMLRECQEELARRPSMQGMPESDVGLLFQAQARLADEEAKNRDAQGKLMEQELKMQHLQQQLADEVKSRMEVQHMVADKERKAVEMQMAMEGDELSRQQALQTQVIEKTREACGLQQQLADELSKRQEVQYQLLEKERVVCDLQNELLGMRQLADMEDAMMHNRPRRLSVADDPVLTNRSQILELPTHHEEFEDTEVDAAVRGGLMGRLQAAWEKVGLGKDDTDQPPSEVDSASERLGERDRGSGWHTRVRTSGNTGSVTVSQTTSPAHPPAGASESVQTVMQTSSRPWGIMSFQPSVLGSPVPVYRTSSTGYPDGFVRSCTGPAMPPGSPVPETPQLTSRPPQGGSGPRGAAMRRSAYSTRGSTGYYMPAGVRTSSPMAADNGSRQDKHARRLMLAARTFT